MRKFREWMTGKGQTTVMVLILVVALGIVGHYFLVERGGVIGPTPTQTPMPKPTGAPMEETIVGGDSLGAVSSDFATVSPAPTEEPEDKADNKASN